MAYLKLYPTIFAENGEEIPDGIKAQFKYPELLYKVQSKMLRVYHNVKEDVLYRNSDIWSLGVSIYELVTGELPFHGWGGQQQLCDRILSLQCDKCSKKLSNLIDACINPDPQNRPSAKEIIALADSVVAGNDNAAPLFETTSDYTDFRKEYSFYNTYNETSLNAMERYNVVKPTDKSIWYC